MLAMSRSRRLLVPAAACCALAIAAPASLGAVVLRTSVSPSTVSFPANLVYSLTMINDGDAQERFAIGLIAPTYRPARTGEAIVESNAIRALGDPAVTGAGSMVGGFTRVSGLLSQCSIAGAGGHGYGLSGVSLDVALPAHSKSTLTAAYEAGLPFWQD